MTSESVTKLVSTYLQLHSLNENDSYLDLASVGDDVAPNKAY